MKWFNLLAALGLVLAMYYQFRVVTGPSRRNSNPVNTDKLLADLRSDDRDKVNSAAMSTMYLAGVEESSKQLKKAGALLLPNAVVKDGICTADKDGVDQSKLNITGMHRDLLRIVKEVPLTEAEYKSETLPVALLALTKLSQGEEAMQKELMEQGMLIKLLDIFKSGARHAMHINLSVYVFMHVLYVPDKKLHCPTMHLGIC